MFDRSEHVIATQVELMMSDWERRRILMDFMNPQVAMRMPHELTAACSIESRFCAMSTA